MSAAGFGKAQMCLGPPRFKALRAVRRGGSRAHNARKSCVACARERCGFMDTGKLSSIIPRKAASIMCGESAADTCS